VISPDVATSIVVSGHEKIGPVAPADQEHFVEFRRAENLLAFQPKSEEINKSPNLSFVTKNVDTGETRNYFFLFHVTALTVGVAAVQFTYPSDRQPAAREAAAQDAAWQTVSSRLATATFYGGGSKKTKGGTNWDYDCMCDAGRDIKPDSFSDNGHDTVFEYRGNRSSAIAISRLSRDGTERPGDLPKIATAVNFTPLSFGSTSYVIPEVAEYWLIISAGQAVAIKNNQFHPELNDLRTGTQSPDVVRYVKPTRPPQQAQQAAQAAR
jgi:type IV secretory pathway VirB9-like protein